jgi:archaea-specific DNA-binding protein
MSDENTVFIGKKPTMNYVLAVVTQFNSGTNEVVIKARGRAISRAVDVAEIVKHRFIQGADYKDIKITTEVVATEGGGTANVSSMEISLSKKAGPRLQSAEVDANSLST